MRTALLILLMAAVAALEFYLALRPKRWPGLVPPGVFFLVSLLYPLSLDTSGGVGTSLMAQALLVWLLANIPTLILLAIYAGVRARVRRK